MDKVEEAIAEIHFRQGEFWRGVENGSKIFNYFTVHFGWVMTLHIVTYNVLFQKEKLNY